MQTYQFVWREANCKAGNCYMNYSANGETAKEAAMEVIVNHLDPTVMLDWEVTDEQATCTYGTLSLSGAVAIPTMGTDYSIKEDEPIVFAFTTEGPNKATVLAKPSPKRVKKDA